MTKKALLTEEGQPAPTDNQPPSAPPDRKSHDGLDHSTSRLDYTTWERLNTNADCIALYVTHLVESALVGDRKEVVATYKDIQELIYRACYFHQRKRAYITRRIMQKTIRKSARIK